MILEKQPELGPCRDRSVVLDTNRTLPGRKLQTIMQVILQLKRTIQMRRFSRARYNTGSAGRLMQAHHLNSCKTALKLKPLVEFGFDFTEGYYIGGA